MRRHVTQRQLTETGRAKSRPVGDAAARQGHAELHRHGGVHRESREDDVSAGRILDGSLDYMMEVANDERSILSYRIGSATADARLQAILRVLRYAHEYRDWTGVRDAADQVENLSLAVKAET